MDTARIAGIAVCLSAIALLAGSQSDVLPFSNGVLTVFVPSLLVLGGLIVLKERWALMPARVLLWLLLAMSAMMIIPDLDDAVRFGDPGLQWRFAIFAGYLLVCIVLVGRVRLPAHADPSKRDRSR